MTETKIPSRILEGIFNYTLPYHSTDTIVIQEVREKWWRVHESTVRVREDHSCRQDVIGIGSADIETRSKERSRISVHASIQAEDCCSCSRTIICEVSSSRSSWNSDIDSCDVRHCSYIWCILSIINLDITIFCDKCPARGGIIRSITDVTLDRKVSFYYERANSTEDKS